MDYFSVALLEVDDIHFEFCYIHNMENMIRLNLKKFENDEHILPQYNWIARKYNEMLFPMVDGDNIESFERKDSWIKKCLEQLLLIL